jgi:hypothetical protein
MRVGAMHTKSMLWFKLPIPTSPSGIMSGLTIGLLAFDTTSLQVLAALISLFFS